MKHQGSIIQRTRPQFTLKQKIDFIKRHETYLKTKDKVLLHTIMNSHPILFPEKLRTVIENMYDWVAYNFIVRKW